MTANNRGQAKGFANHPHVWLPLDGAGQLFSVGEAVAGENHTGDALGGPRPAGRGAGVSSEVPLVSGEIGDDLTYYFAASDQVPTSLGVGVLVDTDQSIRQAGGFIVQLMPGCEDAVVDRLEKNLTGTRSVTDLLEEGMKPTDVLRHVLDGLSYQELDVMPAEFHCGCRTASAPPVWCWRLAATSWRT